MKILNKKLFVLDIDYTIEKDEGITLIYCKDENGNSYLVKDKFSSYFYILPNQKKVEDVKKKVEKIEKKEIRNEIKKVEIVKKKWKNKDVKLIKVFVKNPRRVKNVRDEVKNLEGVEDTFEYAFTLSKRYLIDSSVIPAGWIEVEGIETERENYKVEKVIEARSIKSIKKSGEPKLKILAFDTEFVEDGESKLIMLSFATNYGKKGVITSYDWKGKPSYVISVKNEREIVEKFIEIVENEDPDLIVGYNSDSFDMAKLKERAKKFKIKLKLSRDGSPLYLTRRGRVSSARIRGRVHIDLFNFVSHILAPTLKCEVLTLDEVAKELLKIGKKDVKYKDIVEIWNEKKQLEKLTEYSLWDSELTLKLAEYLLPQIFAISRVANVLPFDASRYTYSQLVESFFIKKAFEDNLLIPNRPKTEEIQRRRLAPIYKGAIVIEPKKGIHSNILVFDFRSLYPTIICSHNIDPFTINCGHKECKTNKPPNLKNYFCKKVEGFIPKHLREVLLLRKKLKDKLKKLKKNSEEYNLISNMQYALKIIANATYGYFGFFGARWYDRRCGEATAAWGRYYITKVLEFAKSKNFEIIYGDTDSLMLKVPEEDIKKIEKIAAEFTSEVNKNLPGIIELEFRGLYEAGIFVTRQKGEAGAKKRYALIDYEGNLEIRGFETVRRDWCNLSKKIQREVLFAILKEKNPEKAVRIVREIIKKIKERKVDLDDLIIYEQITRPLSQYEQLGPHVKAAMKLRERGFPVGEGMVIGFVITKGSGSISDRAMPAQFVKLKDYDIDYYIHHQVLPASLRVLKALGYTEQDILSEKIQKKLIKFF